MAERLAVPLCLVLLLASFSGCSVAMALNGKPEPNFEAFEKGSSRKQVEIQLGQPVSETSLTDGQKETVYHYEMGNSPNGARATLYFYYDLATIGFAEPVFTLIELFQGHTEESRVTYDAQDRLVRIDGYRPPEPDPALKAALKEQEKYTKKPATSGGDVSTASSGDVSVPKPVDEPKTMTDPAGISTSSPLPPTVPATANP